MDSLVIKPTDETPHVICNGNGNISISGKSITEDSFVFYKPILEWIANIEAENIEITVQLEYLNTSSSKQVFDLLKLAKENSRKKSLVIKWYYDSNDEDQYELGKEYESILGIQFEFFDMIK
jgi:hypothetical protein